MLTVSICQCSRNEPDLRGIELEENGARSDKSWPASISNKRRRRRKKSRKTKARDPDVTINLESEEIEAEEVESFEDVIEPLRMDGVGTGGGSRSEQQQHVDVPKVSGSCRILCFSNSSWRPTTAPSTLNFLASLFLLPVLPVPHHILLRPLLIANAMQIKRPRR